MNSTKPDFDFEELTAFVIKELCAFEDLDDIIFEICNRTGWNWQQGEEFVLDVQADHHRLVTRRKNRLLVPLGMAIFLAGIALTLFTGDILWRDYNTILSRYASNEAIIEALIDIVINYGYLFFLGIGMIIGGAYGLGKTLTT